MAAPTLASIKGMSSTSVEDDRSTMRHSGTIRIDPSAYRPTLLRASTLDLIEAVYEDAMGYRFDYERVIVALKCDRDGFPRRLVGPLLIELSKRLHPGRRAGFLRDACETLHQLEGTPRIFSAV
jgi:hypothetical protein